MLSVLRPLQSASFQKLQTPLISLKRKIETDVDVEFYLKNAENKRYFIHIDEEGKAKEVVDTHHGIAERINDTDFCDVFFTFLRRNNMRINMDYPYVCKKGNEFFFVKSTDRPIVFHTIDGNHLVYGKSLTTEFKPKNLAICLENNHLYYPLVGSYIGGVGVFNPVLQSTLHTFVKPSTKPDSKSGYYIEYSKHKYELEPLGIEEVLLKARE